MNRSLLSSFVASKKSAHPPFSLVTSLLFANIGFVGCATSQAQIPAPPPQQKMVEGAQQPPGVEQATASSAKLSPTSQSIQPLASIQEHEKLASQKEIAQLKIDILSLKEQVATLQRKYEVILKVQRSGLYDEAKISNETLARLKPTKPKKSEIPPLTSEGPLDRFEHDSESSRSDKALMPPSPQELVERATLLLESQEFAKVTQLLEDFQQRFPNNGLSAVAELTIAEAYVELKSPLQALTHVRTFYLQHPNDAQLLKAKWLEGRSQELLNAPQKAAQVYREIIALDPQSQHALKARTALEKIGGGTLQ